MTGAKGFAIIVVQQDLKLSFDATFSPKKRNNKIISKKTEIFFKIIFKAKEEVL